MSSGAARVLTVAAIRVYADDLYQLASAAHRLADSIEIADREGRWAA